MKPMESMKPMEPMQPMKPMAPVRPWWPGELGQPASSGGQDGLRYAYFPEAKRLAVEKDGAVTLYDSGEHRIGGVSQDGGAEARLSFSSGGRMRSLEELRKLD